MPLRGGPAVLIPFVRLLAAVVAPASGGAAVTDGREVTPRWSGTKWMSFAASLLSPAAPRQLFCSPAFIRCPSPKANLWLTLSAPQQQSDSGFHINLLNPPDLLLFFFFVSRYLLLSLVLMEASSITKKPPGQRQMASIALQPVRSTCLPASTGRRDSVTRGPDGTSPLPSPLPAAASAGWCLLVQPGLSASSPCAVCSHPLAIPLLFPLFSWNISPGCWPSSVSSAPSSFLAQEY